MSFFSHPNENSWRKKKKGFLATTSTAVAISSSFIIFICLNFGVFSRDTLLFSVLFSSALASVHIYTSTSYMNHFGVVEKSEIDREKRLIFTFRCIEKASTRVNDNDDIRNGINESGWYIQFAPTIN